MKVLAKIEYNGIKINVDAFILYNQYGWENINSINIKLSDDIISEINKVNEEIPNPAP